MIWDPMERFLWGVVITLMIIITSIYIKNGLKRENKQERALMHGFSCLIFCNAAVDRLLRYFSDFLIKGEFKNFTFYGDFNNYFVGFEFLRRLSYIVILLGFIGFMLFTSRIKYRKLNFLLSSILLIFIILIPILPFDIIQIIMLIPLTIGTVYTIFFFLILTKWAKPELKGISFHMLIAISLIFFGFLLSIFQIKNANIVPLIFPPILYFLVTFMFIFPLKIKHEFFQKNLIYYYIIGSLYIGILIYTIIIYILVNISFIYTLCAIILLPLEFIILCFALKFINKGIYSEYHFEKDILDAFSKPKKVTEEEVSVSKEKKICLVCKSKLGRILYMCPDCSTFYCSKCSKALSNLENSCWVCETPFDESKPVRLPEKKEDEIAVIDGWDQKKNKKI